MANTLYEVGRYSVFIKSLFYKPEKFSIYVRQVFREMVNLGIGSLWLVALTSAFMGAVITIQSAYNLVNPMVPLWAVGIVARDSIIIEFSPTIIMLVLAGKVGSNIASEIGTMRVTEQIDALEIMGINSSGYLVLPKIIAAIIICPVVVIVSMIIGITGGWIAGDLSGVVPSADYLKGLQNQFLPFNVTFAMIKTVVFAFIITSVPAYHGYYTNGGALEVGQSSTKGVVNSSILILIFDYILTQLILA
ncbi:MAG TPA: ABC transporter permease [Bacteroidia bacterium]|nr:ABC transporter permease [Bacteroidia bacterium]MBX3107081.1 ABC transporter permease [Bacteroidota bacterium]MCE7956257.1 ABC transporter permease [Bacteroidetes bacterium CHB6]OQB60225.1 MAG: putative phospholipid ABC transporter permease protein MlaE [Bacteroidetes bacterium ADurb.Bin141]MBV6454733.1 putative phospholipid ABC transporter permease protein MlaE [Bacteroidia bacterium]